MPGHDRVEVSANVYLWAIKESQKDFGEIKRDLSRLSLGFLENTILLLGSLKD